MIESIYLTAIIVSLCVAIASYFGYLDRKSRKDIEEIKMKYQQAQIEQIQEIMQGLERAKNDIH